MAQPKDTRAGIGRANAAIEGILRTAKPGATPAHATRAHEKAIAAIESFEQRHGAHSINR